MLKATRLALVTMALVGAGAIAAMDAQAGTFTAGAYPATVKSSGGLHMLMTQTVSIFILCVPKPDGTLASGSESLTLTPNYGTSCESEEKPVHVNENGCDLRLRAGSKVEPEVFSGTMDVVCPIGKAIDFEITSTPICHFIVLPQENKPLFTFRNHPEEKAIYWEAAVNELKYRLSGTCPEAAGEYSGGGYLPNGTLRATKGGLSTSLLLE
jgi:hypothetical protein